MGKKNSAKAGKKSSSSAGADAARTTGKKRGRPTNEERMRREAEKLRPTVGSVTISTTIDGERKSVTLGPRGVAGGAGAGVGDGVPEGEKPLTGDEVEQLRDRKVCMLTISTPIGRCCSDKKEDRSEFRSVKILRGRAVEGDMPGELKRDGVLVATNGRMIAAVPTSVVDIKEFEGEARLFDRIPAKLAAAVPGTGRAIVGGRGGKNTLFGPERMWVERSGSDVSGKLVPDPAKCPAAADLYAEVPSDAITLTVSVSMLEAVAAAVGAGGLLTIVLPSREKLATVPSASGADGGSGGGTQEEDGVSFIAPVFGPMGGGLVTTKLGRAIQKDSGYRAVRSMLKRIEPLNAD